MIIKPNPEAQSNPERNTKRILMKRQYVYSVFQTVKAIKETRCNELTMTCPSKAHVLGVVSSDAGAAWACYHL